MAWLVMDYFSPFFLHIFVGIKIKVFITGNVRLLAHWSYIDSEHVSFKTGGNVVGNLLMTGKLRLLCCKCHNA